MWSGDLKASFRIAKEKSIHKTSSSHYPSLFYRQTPANTNSLNSGTGSHGSHSRGTVCSCNAVKKPSLFATKWPLNKLKHLFLGVKEGNALLEAGGHHKGQLMTASEYTNQIAEIQQKQQKTKRNSSLSSDNFRYEY